MQFSDIQLKPRIFKNASRGEKIMADCKKLLIF